MLPVIRYGTYTIQQYGLYIILVHNATQKVVDIYWIYNLYRHRSDTIKLVKVSLILGVRALSSAIYGKQHESSLLSILKSDNKKQS